MPRPGEVAIALSLALAAVAAGYALYDYVEPAGAGHASTPRFAESTAAPDGMEPIGEPLSVANPFDATEIFEFPAGTSEAQAREAVAGFLLERATRRGAARTPRRAQTKRS